MRVVVGHVRCLGLRGGHDAQGEGRCIGRLALLCGRRSKSLVGRLLQKFGGKPGHVRVMTATLTIGSCSAAYSLVLHTVW